MSSTPRSSSALSTFSRPTNTKKRPSDTRSQPNAKRPRQTLDSFFVPLSPVSSGASENQPIKLNDQQEKVLRMVVNEGKNVFFTGSAGTGKSLLLRTIIAALRKKYPKNPEFVAVTASTGMAASNIGGMTIHAWGAIAPTVQDIEKLISYVKTCRPAYKRWRNAKVLIIDEISMVDGQFFQILHDLAVRLRKKTNHPFGGLQIAVTGDFFQLPPVTRGSTEPIFAFESPAWQTCIERTVNLTQVFRQKDSHFVDLLNELRSGMISQRAIDTFKGLARPLPPSDLQPTELFPLRAEVDKANSTRLDAINEGPVTFIAIDSGSAQPDRRAKLLETLPVPEQLHLKVGAQVMLMKNIDEQLVNGTVGTVISYEIAPRNAGISPGGTGAMRHVQIDATGKMIRGDKENKEVKPSPSHGKDAKSPSSAGSLKDFRTAPQLKAFSSKEAKMTEPPKPVSRAPNGKPAAAGRPRARIEIFPLVEFTTPNGKEIVLVGRDEFRVEDADGALLARRLQVPLILAWAMSIHKSQGQTLQRVKIDLGRVFEKGQSYVALSRAASMDGLQVLGFSPYKVAAHRKVIEWSKTMTLG